MTNTIQPKQFIDLTENKEDTSLINQPEFSSSLNTVVTRTAIRKIPEHVRCWPHPGITTDIRTREQTNELQAKGNDMARSLMARGATLQIAGQMAFQETFGKIWRSTEPMRDLPWGMDRVTYEEACDEAEKWIDTPITSLSCDTFRALLQRLHKLIIDPQHGNLKGVPPGHFRPNEAGFEMLVCKLPEYNDKTLGWYIEHNISLSNSELVRKKWEIIQRELVKAARKGHSYYEMVNNKLVSAEAIKLINEFYVYFPPNKNVIPLVDKLFVNLSEMLLQKETNELFANNALSVNILLFSIGKKTFICGESLKRLPVDGISCASFAHLGLVGIHPFTEANGRMSRLLMNLVLMQTGNQPVGFAYDKTYTAAIRAEDAGHKGSFETFLRKEVEESTPIPLYVAEAQRNNQPLYKKVVEKV